MLDTQWFSLPEAIKEGHISRLLILPRVQLLHKEPADCSHTGASPAWEETLQPASLQAVINMGLKLNIRKHTEVCLFNFTHKWCYWKRNNNHNVEIKTKSNVGMFLLRIDDSVLTLILQHLVQEVQPGAWPHAWNLSVSQDTAMLWLGCYSYLYFD